MRRALRLLWKAARLPVAGIVLLLEPVVQWVCSLVIVLGVVACILFELSAIGPEFPLMIVLGVLSSFGIVLVLYYGLVSLVVED